MGGGGKTKKTKKKRGAEVVGEEQKKKKKGKRKERRERRKSRKEEEKKKNKKTERGRTPPKILGIATKSKNTERPKGLFFFAERIQGRKGDWNSKARFPIKSSFF